MNIDKAFEYYLNHMNLNCETNIIDVRHFFTLTMINNYTMNIHDKQKELNRYLRKINFKLNH